MKGDYAKDWDFQDLAGNCQRLHERSKTKIDFPASCLRDGLTT